MEYFICFNMLAATICLGHPPKNWFGVDFFNPMESVGICTTKELFLRNTIHLSFVRNDVVGKFSIGIAFLRNSYENPVYRTGPKDVPEVLVEGNNLLT